MSSGVETSDLIEPWIYSTLSADPEMQSLVGTQIYGALTPDELTGVYVNFQLLSVRDVMGIGTSRISVDAIYQVQAVDQVTTQVPLIPIARRINQLLDGANVSFNGGYLTCVRETILSRPQVISDAGQTRGGGQAFWHLGSTFRIRANL